MFDFTDISGNARQQQQHQPQYRQVSRPQEAHRLPAAHQPTSQQTAEEAVSNPTLDFPEDPEVEQVKMLEKRRGGRYFDITDSKGQVKAGEVDKAHEEFLKKTEWAD